MVMTRTLVAALAVLAGCSHHGGHAPPDMAFVPAFAARDKVDILFVLADFTILPNVPCPFLDEAFSPRITGGAAPAVRLLAVVPSLGSMCNTDYSAAVDNPAQQIIARPSAS